MTFDEYWQQLEQKNPDLCDSDRMRISVTCFKGALRQAFEVGRKSSGATPGSKIDLSDLFGGAFK